MDHPYFLALIVGALSLFGIVVGFASFEESSNRRKREKNKAENSPDGF